MEQNPTYVSWSPALLACTMFSYWHLWRIRLWRGCSNLFNCTYFYLCIDDMGPGASKSTSDAVPASMAAVIFSGPDWSQWFPISLLHLICFFKRFDDWFFIFQHHHLFFLEWRPKCHQVISVFPSYQNLQHLTHPELPQAARPRIAAPASTVS